MFQFPGDFDLVTLVLLSSVFASTVNAILIGFVLCTFSTLMLLLIIKCKTTRVVLSDVYWRKDFILFLRGGREVIGLNSAEQKLRM